MAAPKPLVWQLIFLAMMVTLFLLVLRDDVDAPGGRLSLGDPLATGPACALDASIADSLKLTAPVSYARLNIDVTSSSWYHRTTNDTKSKELKVPLPSLRHLNILDGDSIAAAEDETCMNHTTLTMPAPSKTNPDASHLVIGVATMFDRLEESLDAFAHWASHTGALILSLVESSVSAGQIAKVSRDAQDLGIELEIARQTVSGDATDGDRYFALVKHLFEHRGREAKRKREWAVLIDDDTFFPSMPALLERLNQFNTAQPQYLGGLPEDLRQMQNFGYMAYGGGGVFMSMPLLEQIYEHFDECNATRAEGGDKRIADCIYAHTPTKLSWESGLHQTDLHGDPSGFYEAGRTQPLSIHHWKSWNEVDVVGLSTVSKICGPSCLLQRYRFDDGWILVNGFSIFKHSGEYEVSEMDMEETWWDAGDYGYSLAPLRPKDYHKVSYRLEKSMVDGVSVRQYYVRRRDSGDGIIEVIWRRR